MAQVISFVLALTSFLVLACFSDESGALWIYSQGQATCENAEGVRTNLIGMVLSYQKNGEKVRLHYRPVEFYSGEQCPETPVK